MSHQTSESGSITVQGLFWTAAIIALSGIVIDGGNGWRTRVQLSVASDAAALAAAQHLDNLDDARAAAVQMARLNLDPDTFGTAISIEDVYFGNYDQANALLLPAEEDPTAVAVVAQRTQSRGNALNNYILGMVGFQTFDVKTLSVAEARYSTVTETIEDPEGGDDRPVLCPDSMIVSVQERISTGGNNEISGQMCIHGAAGLNTGGNDLWTNGVQLSANDYDMVQIFSPRAGSDPIEDLRVERTIAPAVLTDLDEMFDDMWDTLWNDEDGVYLGDLIPDNIGGGQELNIVKVNQGWWSIQPGDVQPNTIYLVNHGAQFSGAVDAHDVVFLVKGQLGVGGGSGLAFRDTFFFAEQDLNLGGDISWGAETWCSDARFNTYLMSKTTVALGGWGGSSTTNGVFMSAPTVRPGGAMRSSGGVYIEAEQTVEMGGNVRLTACEYTMESHYEIDRPMGPAGSSTVTVSREVVKPRLLR